MWLVVLALTAASPRPPITAEAILADLSRRHPISVVESLLQDPAAWETVMRGIASGASEWFKVAHGLGRGVDAGSSEMLEEALSEALVVAPDRTLREFGVEGTCERLGKDDTKPLSAAQVHALVKKRLDALRRVVAPDLQKARGACERALREQEAVRLEAR